MGVAPPHEGYTRMIAYAEHKTHLRKDQLALQAFLAGFWVAVVGHCCTSVSSAFFLGQSAYDAAIARVVYGCLFPGAFVAVVYTGTELYTGNTVAMCLLVLDRGASFIPALLRIWAFSLIGNCAGAVFGGFLLSFCSRTFATEGSAAQNYLFSMVEHKVTYGWGQALALGIGCNLLVCLCTWCAIITDDGAGKIMAMFYTIGVFAMGGFEHIVANFYTISIGYMSGYKEHSFGHALLFNWLPVWLGNTVAGTVLTGCMWWYALHPEKGQLAPYTDQELMVELVRRQSGIANEPVPVAAATQLQQQSRKADHTSYP